MAKDSKSKWFYSEEPEPVTPDHEKTPMRIPVTDTDGTVTFKETFLEDEMSLPEVNYDDVTLSSLIKDGIDPKHLDINRKVDNVVEGMEQLDSFLRKNSKELFSDTNS